MYAEYFAWCMKEKRPFVSPEILDRIRRERRIWLLKGDIFQVCTLYRWYFILTFKDPILKAIVQLRNEIAELTDDDEMQQRDELETELLELIKLDEFAKKRIADYKTDHANLQQQSDTLILTLDFTSTQTSMQDDFNDCVVVIASQLPLKIPPALVDHLVVPEQPPTFVSKPSAEESEIERPKKSRRTKEEMVLEKIVYPKPKDNLRSDIESYKKRNLKPVVR